MLSQMTQLGQVWNFTRVRLDEALDGLSDAQVSWRIYPEAHTIAEICYHIAGCEHYWAARLQKRDPSGNEFEALLDLSAVEGFLSEAVGSPFRRPEDQSIASVKRALDYTAQEIREVIERPTPGQLEMRLVSPIGNDVTGEEGLARLAQHAGYHTGQIWMIQMAPGFPG